MKYADNNAEFYVFEPADMRSLEQIRVRLFSDEPLSDNQRRDLANSLDAIMHKAITLGERQ